jgi:DNA-binding CsgD family transcriptional regulator/catechol 2,3-dioxygenase-like lactoylglutathione lyase family enzyme
MAAGGGGKSGLQAYYHPAMNARHARGRPPHDDVLTPAEWRIVNAVRHGLSNGAIARRRGISLDAVKFHVANAIAKLGLHDRVALRRYGGVAKHSLLHRQLPGKDRAMPTTVELGPIGQIARTVRDIAAAEAWYGGVLGLKHLFTFGKLAFYDCGGTRLLLSAEGGEAKPESILYLRVADIAAAHRQLVERGVAFLSAPHMIHRHADGTEEWMAFFKDEDERPLALMAQAKP